VEITTSVKPRANYGKKLSKLYSQKIHICSHVDDIMIHNLVKYLVQTRHCLCDIKITFFLNLLFLYLTKMSSLDKIFYKIVYHHVIYVCIL
jgi:hypothetical protein